LLELRDFKELDGRIAEINRVSGRFFCKPRVLGEPSTLPPPVNPVMWAVSDTEG